jgi:SAM-dependent methyltransferase
MTTTATATAFNPVKYKATTREQWQAAARAWNDWGPSLRTWLGPATELMLDMAGIGRGHRVLDVAAGAGDQTLQAAERVGPTGYVLATDISDNILDFAAHNAREAGHGNVETQVLDGEDLDVPAGTFDAVISRVGLIYFPDQQKALAGMKRALKPGGRVAAIVYSTADNNRFFSIPVSVIRRRANLPPPVPGQPGPFSLGGPGVLEETFRKAGFRDVTSRTIAAPVRMPTAADCVRFEKESFGALHQMLAGLDHAGREAAWHEIEQELSCFETRAGFEGPCEMIVAVGSK